MTVAPVVLLSSEAVRPRMAGIGLRYRELARALAGVGVPVVLASPASPEEMREAVDLPAVRCETAKPGELARLTAGAGAAVAQGQLGNDLLLECPELPVAIDLYDPFLIEHFHYLSSLGLDPYRNDHATWMLQMTRGDFFLCSSQEQRLFYLGFLTACGRVNPELAQGDPTLGTLIAVVPFLLPSPLPAPRALLAPRETGERRILFGGLYDWYDPETLLAAVGRPEFAAIDAQLFFVRHPSPESTPQRLMGEVERRVAASPALAARVRWLDWVPAERRFDLLREMDVLAAPHQRNLETDVSLRTRFLDAWAVGCPVVTSEGGSVARLIAEHGAGWVARPGDSESLAACVRAALLDEEARRRVTAAGKALVEREFAGPRALAPLLEFCARPRREATRQRFAHSIGTRAPLDSTTFRAGRLWRRVVKGLRGGG